MIPPLILTGEKDGVRTLFQLDDDYGYNVEGSLFFIVIPKGFKTDFATIPFPLNSFWNPQDIRWANASLVHDYLYRKGSVVCVAGKEIHVNRKFADELFFKIMRSGKNKTPKYLANIFFCVVRVAGYFTWQDRYINF